VVNIQVEIFWVAASYRVVVDSNVSEDTAASIFRAKVVAAWT
jgi:hypothetical protein